MKYFVRLSLGLLAGFALLSGCATMSGQVPERTNPNMVLVYGRMDLSPAKDQLTFVSLLHYPYKMHAYLGQVTDVRFTILSDGTFFAANVTPGSYVLWRVMGAIKGGFFGNSQTVYSMAPENPGKFTQNDAVRFAPASLAYLGAWKLKMKKKAGLFTQGSFTIAQNKHVSEADILKEILPYTKGTQWDNMIRNALGMPPVSATPKT